MSETPIDPNLCFCGDAQEGAALGLLALMTGLSEACWFAGWATGLEFWLWDIAPGERGVTERQVALLRLLSDEADGWWVWNDEADRPEFLPLDTWKQRVEEIHGRGRPRARRD